MSVDLKSDGLTWDKVDSFSLDSVDCVSVFCVPTISMHSVWADDVGLFQLRFIFFYTFFFCQGLWSGATPRQGITILSPPYHHVIVRHRVICDQPAQPLVCSFACNIVSARFPLLFEGSRAFTAWELRAMPLFISSIAFP